MLLISLILGGEAYWQGVVGFIIGGFIFGSAMWPLFIKKLQEIRL
ncbi:hypothetical protein [Geomicrobium sp. JCM 19055]|nr:hypothetical protein [Geomicrobium sp. JCM 19055]